jgi:competence protein ComEC
MFTGDAGHESEEDMLSKHSASAFRSDVIKLGHHGSSTSSSEKFIKAVAPKYAIISCGKDNSYGHPHEETVELLNKLEIPYFITYEVGNIIFVSDGTTLTLKRPAP